MSLHKTNIFYEDKELDDTAERYRFIWERGFPSGV